MTAAPWRLVHFGRPEVSALAQRQHVVRTSHPHHFHTVPPRINSIPTNYSYDHILIST
jgi:hypothetical protein